MNRNTTPFEMFYSELSSNQRLHSAGEFQASDRRLQRSCSYGGPLCKFHVIEGQNACNQIKSDRRYKSA